MGDKNETRKIPALSLRAAVRSDSINTEKRTVDLVWSTGARVMRGFWESFWEELSLDEGHVRMDRLNNGAPLLNSHNSYDLRAVIGVVESGTAKIDGKQGTATVRFAKAEDDPEADAIFRKIVDKIITNVSVGYRVHKFEKVEGGDEKIPVYRAVDWEPHEISVVAVGADAGAGMRSADELQNECILITRSEERAQENTPMPEKTEKTPVAVAAPTVDDAAVRAEATKVERERAAGIRQAVRAAKLGDDLAEQMIRDGVELGAARAQVLDALAAKDDAVQTSSQVRVEVGTDIGRTAAHEGMRNALMHRVNPSAKLEEVGRQFRGMALMDMARESLLVAGVKTRGMTKMEVAALALGMVRGGMHSTSDFPLLLADVANKSLLNAYTEAPATYQMISRRTTIPDFKPVRRYRLGEAPSLLQVNENGEFKRGTIGEGKEQYQLATYGRVLAFSRQMLINDDLDAISRVPSLFGRSARDLESNLVWGQITDNPVMGDGIALFHASHGNLGDSGDAAAISITSIGAARHAMRQQKGLDGVQFINVAPKFLIVPTELETVAEQFLSPLMMPITDATKNPFQGKLTPIAEPRLDAVDGNAWYLAADPSQIDTVEYAFLEGEEGPVMESRIGFDVDGMEIKCRHDFAAKVIDHKGLYRNDGA